MVRQHCQISNNSKPFTQIQDFYDEIHGYLLQRTLLYWFLFFIYVFSFAFKKVFVPGRHDGRGSVTHSWKRMQSGKFRKSFKIFCQAYRNKLGISKVFSVCAILLLSAYVIRIV